MRRRLRVGDRVQFEPGDEGTVIGSHRWKARTSHEEMTVRWNDGHVDQVTRAGWGTVGVPPDIRVTVVKSQAFPG